MGKAITLIIILIGFLMNGILFSYQAITGGGTNELIVSGIWMLFFYNTMHLFMTSREK